VLLAELSFADRPLLIRYCKKPGDKRRSAFYKIRMNLNAAKYFSFYFSYRSPMAAKEVRVI